jgi:hypothetical protein
VKVSANLSGFRSDTSFSPNSSPTLLCLIAPDETRVIILPDPVEVGCEGRGVVFTF